MTIRQWIENCRSAALDAAPHGVHAEQTAFEAAMPDLTSRQSTQAYIACVAAGLRDGQFRASEVKLMLYTAQTALSAFAKSTKTRTTKGRKHASTNTPHPIGFNVNASANDDGRREGRLRAELRRVRKGARPAPVRRRA